MVDFFAEALANFGRIAITGGSGTGKTTLCERVNGRDVVHTDDYMHMEWSEASRAVCEKVNSIHGPVVVEGVRVPHALRKGMRVDCVIWLDTKYTPHNKKHTQQREQMLTIIEQWRQANPQIPFLIPAPLHLRKALPVQIYPEPGDFDESHRRKQGVRRT